MDLKRNAFLLLILPFCINAGDIAKELPQMVGKTSEELIRDHAETIRDLKLGARAFYGYAPWHVWSFKNSKNETRYLLFAAEQISIIPGHASALIKLFSSHGEVVSSWQFSTGWRLAVGPATTAYDEALKAQIITVTSDQTVGGLNVAKQIFALVDERLYYIRTENKEGMLVQNHYESPNFTFGGALPANDFDEWLALLESPRLPLKMAALTFLSGIHRKPNALSGKIYETREQYELVTKLRESDQAKKIIQECLKSEIQWVKEAAKMAASPNSDKQ